MRILIISEKLWRRRIWWGRIGAVARLTPAWMPATLAQAHLGGIAIIERRSILVALHDGPRPLKLQDRQQGQGSRTMDMASQLLYIVGLQDMLVL